MTFRHKKINNVVIKNIRYLAPASLAVAFASIVLPHPGGP